MGKVTRDRFAELQRPSRPDNPEEAVEAVVSAIAKENFWDAKAPEVRRGVTHLAETYVEAAAPALRKQGAEEARREIENLDEARFEAEQREEKLHDRVLVAEKERDQALAKGAEEALAAAKSICPACGRVGSGTGACRRCSAEGEATVPISDLLAQLRQMQEVEAELHRRDEEQDAIRRKGAEEERARLREQIEAARDHFQNYYDSLGNRGVPVHRKEVAGSAVRKFTDLLAALDTPAPSEEER